MLSEPREAGPSTALMRKAYARWAPVYDVVYDKLTEPAARDAVEAAVACGPRILEAGVGTGLSLGYYPRTSFVCGVDLSEDMLKRARAKVLRRGLTHVRGLQVMDVCRLGYADASFDAVVAQFLITLVPDPEGALSEFLRVVRPGGEIVLANHFGQTDGPMAKVEEIVAPLCTKIGWSSDFKSTRIEAWARTNGVEFIGVAPTFPGGFFKILRMRKRA
ncbi:SAM-dependent methyltransferase [Methylobacterium sp. Leaf102]|jgi:phosphatidylethanolamine/phosphatidyl-N-methylethanolamine N-methyltransferase|uniref:class I SAM-dependent methyltransferase n=1 Tax=unclassified Methylobacterium TaxID=2615210 RepID=UPI0006F4A3D7|nr:MULTISPECIES: class I SAM-dependent methyltransferase [unclassified Methylobacterium]KQP24711.1 SAM-dependent methyltransferase [Methylobacterium sp. Leaf102]KQP35993.1 SAM-dependent methyltransferase [Methylobacterium sp. Leaf100]KQP60505.1 SAM-dependent methyltransferase [Methylobacterium sp. Leaf112]USU31026.1 class I SAM-dependent methyltransferase [Methylobacterium sp. OTU13CASTA1]